MKILRILTLFVLSNLQICAHYQNIDSLLSVAPEMEPSIEKAEFLLEAAKKQNKWINENWILYIKKSSLDHKEPRLLKKNSE